MTAVVVWRGEFLVSLVAVAVAAFAAGWKARGAGRNRT